MMQTILSNDITIINPNQEICDWCEQNLILENPEYNQMKRLGKDDLIKWKHIPEYIYVYSYRNHAIKLPFGCLNGIWNIIKNYPYECKFNNAGEISFKNDKVNIDGFYDYQEEAINFMVNTAKGGVLVAGCGAGKTYCGMEIIKRIGKKALWLCHTGDLLRQAKTDLLKLYPNAKIELTTAGKLNIGEDITISTVQTISKIDPIQYRDEFDVVICDECAHVAGTPTQLKMFSKVLSSIPARYKFGLTATPTRADGLVNSMYAYIGMSCEGKFKPVFTIDKSKLKTLTAQHVRIDVESGLEGDEMYRIYDTSGMLNYNALIDELCTNSKRNQIILDNVKKCKDEGRKQVVLSLRVEHCKYLVEQLQKMGVNAVLCVGNTSAKTRSAILNQQTNWDVIVSTYSLLKEGVSVNSLDTLHLTGPAKEKGLIIQCAGRIERFVENKLQPLVFDYVDIDIPYCENAYKKRRTALRTRRV